MTLQRSLAASPRRTPPPPTLLLSPPRRPLPPTWHPTTQSFPLTRCQQSRRRRWQQSLLPLPAPPRSSPPSPSASRPSLWRCVALHEQLAVWRHASPLRLDWLADGCSNCRQPAGPPAFAHSFFFWFFQAAKPAAPPVAPAPAEAAKPAAAPSVGKKKKVGAGSIRAASLVGGA